MSVGSGAVPSGGPSHIPVLLDAVLDLLAPVVAPPAAPSTPQASPVIVDATLGLGGHTEAMLERFADLVVIGIDRDALSLCDLPELGGIAF